jgi:hypothetical protein
VNLATLVVSAGLAATAHGADRTWSGQSALTLPRGRLEIGLVRGSRYGISDRVEAELHPVLFFALPHLEIKANAYQARWAAVAARARMSYPTPFLRLVSREGTGGLLPATSRPPQAIQVEGDVVGTLFWMPRQLATLSAGLAVAPHARFGEQDLPLLDFPFLYPRFAPLYTVLVPRAALALEGVVAWRIFYALALRGYVMPELPYVGNAIAVEQDAAIEYRISAHVAVSVGLLAAETEYPIGWRLHLLPYLDVRVGW